jgi:CRP-like cAMP-binding protein
MNFREINKGEYLYKKGDNSEFFYFVLRGKIELVADNSEGGEFKFSKNIDENEIFGLRTDS